MPLARVTLNPLLRFKLEKRNSNLKEVELAVNWVHASLMPKMDLGAASVKFLAYTFLAGSPKTS
jgi:hypothetical protein